MTAARATSRRETAKLTKHRVRSAPRRTREPHRLARSRLGVRSQTVIPKAVRDALGLSPGDEVVFEITSDGVVLRKSARGAENPFASFLEWSSDADVKGYAGL
jgi:antitoxin PrlF